jgi:hypothetical protein
MQLLFPGLVIALGYTLVTFAAGLAVGMLLKEFSSAAETKFPSRGLRGAGKAIGWLERLLVFTFVLIGYYNGIGFVLTAKSLLRYGEIKNAEDHAFAEYVIVGTLLSFSVAVLIGIVVRLILGMPTAAVK